jgi:hypothetical protein
MWHMDANQEPNNEMQSRYSAIERRNAPRIETPFPAVVRSIDVANQPFEVHTVLDNFCGHGVYLRLARQLRLGAKSFVLIRLSIMPNATATFVALHGVVLRTEKRSGGAFGTAIRIVHYRFIYTAAHEYSWQGR